MSKLLEKLGQEKYKSFLELIKGTDIKESEVDLLDGYVPRVRLNEVTEKLKATEEKNNTLIAQSDETKKMLEQSEKFKEETEEYKKKYSDLETKHKSDLEGKSKEIENVLKRSLVKEKLIESGAKHPNLLMKEINFDDVQVKEDKLFGFDDTLKGINETYKDLFTTTENKQNLQTGGAEDDVFQDSDFDFLDNIKK